MGGEVMNPNFPAPRVALTKTGGDITHTGRIDALFTLLSKGFELTILDDETFFITAETLNEMSKHATEKMKAVGAKAYREGLKDGAAVGTSALEEGML